ncbi:alpha/beta hydrolase [Paracoccus aestuarii]|nr:alpha/beta hydrolase [Paracoccus aestuarii]WCQ99857.1 alpha/beta hydrolase [Paracoccus aestuarii]
MVGASRLWSRAALVTAVLAVAACAPRADLSLMNPPPPGSLLEAERFEVLAVTTRARQSPTANVFTTTRSLVPSHALFHIAAAQGRQPGVTQSAGHAPVIAVERQAIITSRQALLDHLAGSPRPRDISLFIHGFNLNFPEALMRTAQLSADEILRGQPLLFAWPSEARVQGYLHDRDSVIVSRDALVQLLVDLAGDARLGNVDVLAHSMGALLMVEAMRQLRLTGRGDVLDQLSVTLASPDIDLDVFAAQMAVIGPMRRPMKILVARDDRALILAGRLSGEARLGVLDVANPRVQKAAEAYNIAIIDISELRATDGLRHDRYAGLGSRGATRAQLRELRQAGAFGVTALGAIVSAPFDVLEGALALE